MENISISKSVFPVIQEYNRCFNELKNSNIISILPKSETFGVIGIDGNEYPIPTQQQVLELFVHNSILVERKVKQGFNCLELIPIAMPITELVDLLRTIIVKHAIQGNIFPTGQSDTLLPLRVNKDKQVWLWETLKQAIEKDELVYFPNEYSNYHGGQTKLEVIANKSICAFPGWSVGIVENLHVMPQTGHGKIVGGRKQLEIGL